MKLLHFTLSANLLLCLFRNICLSFVEKLFTLDNMENVHRFVCTFYVDAYEYHFWIAFNSSVLIEVLSA